MIKKALASLSLFALTLFAGAALAQDTGGMMTGGMTGGDMTGGAMTGEATVESTLSLLEGGLTDVDPGAALANIQSWQTQLEGSDDETLQIIAGQLDELQTALSADSIDTDSVSTLLVDMGENTVAAAGDDAQITALGTLLSNAGASLSGE